MHIKLPWEAKERGKNNPYIFAIFSYSNVRWSNRKVSLALRGRESNKKNIYIFNSKTQGRIFLLPKKKINIVSECFFFFCWEKWENNFYFVCVVERATSVRSCLYVECAIWRGWKFVTLDKQQEENCFIILTFIHHYGVSLSLSRWEKIEASARKKRIHFPLVRALCMHAGLIFHSRYKNAMNLQIVCKWRVERKKKERKRKKNLRRSG